MKYVGWGLGICKIIATLTIQIFHLPEALLTQWNWWESKRFLLLCILYLIQITFSFLYDHLYCIYQRFYSYLLWLFHAQLRFIVISHVGFKNLCLMKNHSWILTENFQFMIFVFDATTTRLTFYQLLRLRYVCITTSNSCGFVVVVVQNSIKHFCCLKCWISSWFTTSIEREWYFI